MASGSFDFAVAGNKLQGRITWSSSSNGPIANTSNVSAILYAKRTDGYTTTGQSWSGYVKIASSQVNISFSSSVSVSSSWVEMARISNIVVAHNTNGTGSAAISGSVTGPSGTSLSGVTSLGNSTVTLDTIARYFSTTPTISLESKTETSFRLKWNTSELCSKVVLNVGGSTYSTTNVNATEGHLDITGRQPLTQYSIYGTFTRKDSGLTSNSGTAKWTTHPYPYVTEIETQNLIIGNTQKVTLYNPIPREVTVYMRKNGVLGNTLASGTTSGTEITLSPQESTLYASIPSSQSGRAYYVCEYDNYTTAWKEGTYSIKGNENPTFEDFTFEDINPTTTALTGDNSIIVKGYSNVQISVPVANKATANNSATMVAYQMQVEGMNAIQKNYSATEEVTATQNAATSERITVTAIDSRGLPTTASNAGTLKAYFKPYIRVLEAKRHNGVGTEVTLSYEIDFWNQTFGSVRNTVQALSYRYRGSGDWTTGTTTLTYDFDGNKIVGSLDINGDLAGSGFTLGDSFTIELTITDRLNTITGTATLLSGTPAIAIRGSQVAIGGPVEPNMIKDFQIKKGGLIVVRDGAKINGDSDIEGSLNVTGNVKVGNKTITETKLNQIETDIADSGWTTVNPSVGSETIKVRRIGNIVNLYVFGDYGVSLANNSTTTFASIPANYRPSANIIAPCVLRNASGTEIAQVSFYVQSDGSLRVRQKTGSAFVPQQIFACITYFVG